MTLTLNEAKQLVKKTNNHRPYGRIEYSIPLKITSKEAMEIQTLLGYNPLGYGFHSFVATAKESTWSSSNYSD